MLRVPALALVAMILAGCPRTRAPDARGAPGAQPTAQLSAGNHNFTLRQGGRAREFIVHMPPRTTGALAVLLAFHGGGGNAAGFQRSSGLDAVSDREAFVVVYPNGSGPLANQLLTFNAGDGCCGFARNNNVDDVGFAVAIVEDIALRTPVNRRRIYATGHSNGGMMSHRVAAERSDYFAAAAPVAGALDLARFNPTTTIPILQIHSVDDPRALYDGGLGPPFPGTNSRVQHQSVRSGLDRWVAANGCRTTPDTVEKKSGAAGTRNAGITMTRLVWRPCRGGAEVAHLRLTGSGHGWPGNATPGGGEALAGPQTNIILAAEEVWGLSRVSPVDC